MAAIHDDEFLFEIEAFSPATISMERLAQYMAVFAKLLANAERVHFKQLRPGSTVLVASAEREAIPKVATRLVSIKVAEAPKDALDSLRAANEMLREDNGVGRVYHGRTKRKQDALLYLPGREIPKPKLIGPFNEPVTIKGELVRLEGEDATKHAGIKDAQGHVWSGDMSVDLAKQLAPYAWEWVEVHGTARWIRDENGKWDMRSFHITSGRGLPRTVLEDDVKALRQIPGNQWEGVDDVSPPARPEDEGLH